MLQIAPHTELEEGGRDPVGVGLICGSESLADAPFVGLQWVEADEALFEAAAAMVPGHEVSVCAYQQGRWNCFTALVAKCDALSACVSHGRLHKTAALPMPEVPPMAGRIMESIDFFLTLPMLGSLPVKSLWGVLNCLRNYEVPAGERFIAQGSEAHSLFIIEHGLARVTIRKGDAEYAVARLGPGDIAGEIAVLTGGVRNADVVALENMVLWELAREPFHQAMDRLPDLRAFLTEVVSRRLETSSHAADREVGKYVAQNKLGSGAWAIVYQGVHKALKKTVAIKMLKHRMSMDAEFSDKFLREAKIIAGLNHPNIVHVFDIESLYATRFIIMEYLEGESLEQLLARVGSLTSELAIHYLLQICAGLEYAHGRGIIHQDIKPDNILVQKDDSIKILDFGLACPTGSENFEMEGTLQYMSPEQINSFPVDERTDIYCMGITAYEMVTGMNPFAGDDFQKLLTRRLEEDIAGPATLKDNLPARLDRFILACCARIPEERFQSATQARAELELIAEDLGMHESSQIAHHMSSLFLIYTDEQRTHLTRLLEEFSAKVNEAGIRVKFADFTNIIVQ